VRIEVVHETRFDERPCRRRIFARRVSRGAPCVVSELSRLPANALDTVLRETNVCT